MIAAQINLNSMNETLNLPDSSPISHFVKVANRTSSYEEFSIKKTNLDIIVNEIRICTDSAQFPISYAWRSLTPYKSFDIYGASPICQRLK